MSSPQPSGLFINDTMERGPSRTLAPSATPELPPKPSFQLAQGRIPPENPPSEYEVNVLRQARGIDGDATEQNVPFTSLPPELRNEIYKYLLPTQDKGQALVIACPYIDRSKQVASQPAITRVSRRIRSETLPMFYANSTFEVHIMDWNFQPLIRWISHTYTSTESPMIKVHVQLVNLPKYEFQMLGLMRAWRDAKHSKIHLMIHKCVGRSRDRLHLRRCMGQSSFDVRKLAVSVIKAADDLSKKGLRDECSLRKTYVALVNSGEDLGAWAVDMAYRNRLELRLR